MANEQAKRDDNQVTSLLGVSNADGSSTVAIYADPSTHRLLISGVGTTGPTGPTGATGPAGGVVLSNQAYTAGATGAVASVATATVGGADANYMVVANVNCTAYTAGNFATQVVYVDDTNATITVSMQGHFTSGYGTTISGVGNFEGQPLYIRAKAGSTITIKTAGTFTNLTYNVSGAIMLVS